MTERKNNNYNNENKRYQNNYNNRRNNYKKPNKGLIIVRSTVFALGIVLITLVAIFVLMKNKKTQENCSSNVLSIKKSAKIVKFNENSILLETINKDNIEILRIKNDTNCPRILNKIQIKK
jgi:hypothetical protein